MCAWYMMPRTACKQKMEISRTADMRQPGTLIKAEEDRTQPQMKQSVVAAENVPSCVKRPDSSFRNALVANDLRVVPPPPRIRNETMTKPKADKDHKHARIQCTKTRQMKIVHIAQCPSVSPQFNAIA